MSVVLRLDDSVIQVAPTLGDVEAILIVRTLREDPITGAQRRDGTVRRIVPVGPRRSRTKLPHLDFGSFSETQIGPHDRTQTAYETWSYFTVGGTASGFLSMDRRVQFGARWYGKDDRYLELRLQVSANVSDIVVNRGMGQFGQDESFNFLDQFKKTEWVAMHFDNHAHVGVSMVVHSDLRGFSVWEAPLEAPTELQTRFEKILG